MIIQAAGPGALLITQPDHAALSARIMTAWRDRDFDRHPRRSSVLLAIGQHDNGWREVDAAPVLDTSGRMLDFMNVPADTRRAIWPRGVRRLVSNPWAAALVAQHAVHVYRHYRDEGEWAPFFSELESSRDEHVRRAAASQPRNETALDLDVLLDDYFFVRMGDLLSLTFCNGWTEAPDELGYDIRCNGQTLSVCPDPFGRSEFAIEVTARELPRTGFESPAEAARAFDSAPAAPYRGVARGSSRT